MIVNASETRNVADNVNASSDKLTESRYGELLEHLESRANVYIKNVADSGRYNLVFPTAHEVSKYITENELGLVTPLFQVVMSMRNQLSVNLRQAGYEALFGNGGDIKVNWGIPS